MAWTVALSNARLCSIYLGKSETRSCSLNAAKFLPNRSGDILGHQGVGRLDLWERLRHGQADYREGEE